jgi:uridine kinase
MKEKIQARIDEYQKELDKWNEQWRQIQDGEIPMMPPYADMVVRHQAMYGYQIAELKWVLEQMNDQ